ncbi:hypothetical protein G6F70_008288 [Rhizopus microsporus]|uniref:Peptidyl-prolyl isomerase CWC27 n=2 Tax=Rhizopus TaxID=4842 RepID=A0A367K6B0_RHIAZ|nr:hypothetical protein G6F71_008320 [Rhizopus microsporus]RCH97708.1 Peptidyl-prolyl isomerase cwc27 [Rhizopus azygosporus]KAG1195364.1 hypothetical protein G6F70_008288 [Rhizopus microsporus]KAG1207158.1 hypothetical protein G6F69_008269 [Rhizopus microsporus]KAG1230104.1 hypothetical protein G6F67_006687 [Rhizopus microsporus]
MSNIYALEPHTNAKVILYTTAGDIEIELWGKEAPRASRNFIQLCLEGYYDNTIFHRIIPGFLVQGGDPTGTGQGGESIYEDGFPDEFHSRLRFNRRGLVGVANTGQNDNGSQFFITLDRADELTKKHTLFGRVAGDTLFNVMKMTELELDQNDRPLYPPRIKRTEVVINPFDDIVPRISERERRLAQELERKRAAEAAEQAKKKKKPQKQLNLLSFGEEAGDLMPPEEKEKKTVKKSAYDFVETAAPPSEELLQELQKPVSKEKQKQEEKERQKEEEERKRQKEEEERKKQKELEEARRKRKELEEKKKQEDTAESRASAIEKLKQDIRNLSKTASQEEVEPVIRREKKMSLVEQEREKYAGQKRKRAKKGDDSDVFNKLLAFQKKLSSVKEETVTPKKELPPCELHGIPGCESCRDMTNVEDDVSDEGWIAHKLVFEKDLKGKDLMRRRETVDDYVVIDPRSRQAKAIQEEYERKRGTRTGDSQKRNHDEDRKYREEKRSRSDRYRRSRSRSRDRHDSRR